MNAERHKSSRKAVAFGGEGGRYILFEKSYIEATNGRVTDNMPVAGGRLPVSTTLKHQIITAITVFRRAEKKFRVGTTVHTDDDDYTTKVHGIPIPR